MPVVLKNELLCKSSPVDSAKKKFSLVKPTDRVYEGVV